jgi:hypothetical protein
VAFTLIRIAGLRRLKAALLLRLGRQGALRGCKPCDTSRLCTTVHAHVLSQRFGLSQVPVGVQNQSAIDRFDQWYRHALHTSISLCVLGVCSVKHGPYIYFLLAHTARSTRTSVPARNTHTHSPSFSDGPSCPPFRHHPYHSACHRRECAAQPCCAKTSGCSAGRP